MATRSETNEGNDKHQSKAERKQNTYQEATATAELGWVAVAICGTTEGNDNQHGNAERKQMPSKKQQQQQNLDEAND